MLSTYHEFCSSYAGTKFLKFSILWLPHLAPKQDGVKNCERDYSSKYYNKCNTRAVVNTKCFFTRCLQRVGHILYKVHVQEPTYLTGILLVGCRNYINLQLILRLDYINKYTLYVHVLTKIQGQLYWLQKPGGDAIYTVI